jgi:hypothetical protein
MPAPDDFSSYIGELLRGSYDCVDRIVLRAYFAMGQTSRIFDLVEQALSQHRIESGAITTNGW